MGSNPKNKPKKTKGIRKMCLAIYKPKGEPVPLKRLKTGFARNPHGAGFAYVAKDGRVKIQKGFFTFESFYNAYLNIGGKKKAMLIHFRWATKGSKTKANCHPFPLPNNQAMVHNGTIQRILCKDGGSDSSNFAKRVLSPIIKKDSDFIHTVAGQKLINLAIGESKVAVLDEDGNATIFNENKGHWDGEIWYSNETYKLRGLRNKSSLYTKAGIRKAVSSKDILRPMKDYHASNRGRGRSYIDDLQDQLTLEEKWKKDSATQIDGDILNALNESGLDLE